MIESQDIQNEEEIVWLEDITRLAYVRQGFAMDDNRRGLIALTGSKRRLVGYANVGADGWDFEPGTMRRAFWLCDHDPYGYHADEMPCEAVNPLSVEPGNPGSKLWPRSRVMTEPGDEAIN